MEGGGGGTPGRSIRGQDAPPNLTNPWESLNSLFKTGAQAYTLYDKLKQEAKFEEQQEQLGALYKKAQDEDWTQDKLLNEKQLLVNTHITEEPLWRYRKQQEALSADVAAKQWELEQKKIEADEAAAARLDAQRTIDEWDQIVGSPVYAPGSSTGNVPAQLGGGSTGDLVSAPPNILSGDLETATNEAVDHAIAHRYGGEFGRFPPERQKRIRDIYTKQFSSEVLRRRRELRDIEEKANVAEADAAGQVNFGADAVEFNTPSDPAEAERMAGNTDGGIGAVTDESWGDIETYITAGGQGGLRWDQMEQRSVQAAQTAANGVLEHGEGTMAERRAQAEKVLNDPRFDKFFGDKADDIRKALITNLNDTFAAKVSKAASDSAVILIEEEGINLSPKDADRFRDTQFMNLGLELDEDGKWILPDEGTPEYKAVSDILRATASVRQKAAVMGDQRIKVREANDKYRREAEGAVVDQGDMDEIFEDASSPAMETARDMIGLDNFDFTDEQKTTGAIYGLTAWLNSNPNSPVPTDVVEFIQTMAESNDPYRRMAAARLYHGLDSRQRSYVVSKDDAFLNNRLNKMDRMLTEQAVPSNDRLMTETSITREQFDGLEAVLIDDPKRQSEATRDMRTAIDAQLTENLAYGLTGSERSWWEGWVNDKETDIAQLDAQNPVLMDQLRLRTAELVTRYDGDVAQAAQHAMSEFQTAGFTMVTNGDTPYIVRDVHTGVDGKQHRHLDFDAGEGGERDEGDRTMRLFRRQMDSTVNPTIEQAVADDYGLTIEELRAARESAGLGATTLITQGELLRIAAWEKLNRDSPNAAYALETIPPVSEWNVQFDMSSPSSRASMTDPTKGLPFRYEIPFSDRDGSVTSSTILGDGFGGYLTRNRVTTKRVTRTMLDPSNTTYDGQMVDHAITY